MPSCTVSHARSKHGAASITTSCKHVALAAQWLNYMYTDAARELANWGIEGLNYFFKGHNVYTLAYPDTTCHANLLKSPPATAIRLEYDDDLPGISLTEEELDTRVSERH